MLAFFYMSEDSRAEATGAHARFLEAYGLPASHCPLLRLDLYGGAGDDPFVDAG